VGLFRSFKKEPTSNNSTTYLLVGLGNPGREYRYSRHNFGFMAIEQMADELNIRMSRMQSKAIIGVGSIGEARVVLARPQTFMNLSGQSVSGLLRFYKVPLERMLVIHDDIDLPFGTLRLRPEGGSGGQRGLASVIQQLGTQSFPRMRLGVGRPPGRMQPSDYVLQAFSPGEQEMIKIVLGRAAEAARTFVLEGLEKAMNHYNGAVEA
jgi:PTH1 family peptidyl-tRNA hydrolase